MATYTLSLYFTFFKHWFWFLLLVIDERVSVDRTRSTSFINNEICRTY